MNYYQIALPLVRLQSMNFTGLSHYQVNMKNNWYKTIIITTVILSLSYGCEKEKDAPEDRDPEISIESNRIICKYSFEFGKNIAAHDDHILVSDYESVRIFRHTQSTLELLQTIDLGWKGGIFDMVIQDSMLAVAFGDDNGTGNVFLYERNDAQWELEQEIRIGREKDAFGWDIDIEGEYMVVGAPAVYTGSSPDPSDPEGRVYIFKKTPEGWIREAELKAMNSSYADKFGTTVAVNNGLVLASSAFTALHIFELEDTWDLLRVYTFNTNDISHYGDNFLFLDVYYNTSSFILEPDGSFNFFEVNYSSYQGHNPIHTASFLGDSRDNSAVVVMDNKSYCYLIKYENSRWLVAKRINAEDPDREMISGSAITDDYVIYGVSSTAGMEYVSIVEY